MNIGMPAAVTVMLVLAGPLLPRSDVISPVVKVVPPTVMPVMSKATEHVAPAAMLGMDAATPPGAGRTVPPEHVEKTFGTGAGPNPIGKPNVPATFVAGTNAAVLAIFKVKRVMPPCAIVGVLLIIVTAGTGAGVTVSVAIAGLVLPIEEVISEIVIL